MIRGGNFKIIISLLFLIIFLGVVSAAANVAFIVKDDARVEKNYLSIFKELNLSVEVIEDAKINSRTNFNKYDIILVNDYLFNLRNTQIYLDISKHKTIMINPFEGEEYGLTDKDGISSLTSNAPLSVTYKNSIVQVYNSATDNRRRALQYYYLSKENVAPGFERIAGTYKGGSEILGDVISVANPGARLSTGKITKEKVCFFGIANSNYWTPAARKMFKDECVGFVAFEVICHNDSECNDNDSYTKDTCVNPGQYTSFCKNENIQCLSEADCGTDGYIDGKFCSVNNVAQTYRNFSCLQAGTPQSQCTFEDKTNVLQQCSPNLCSNGACVQPLCKKNSDCGIDGFVGENICTTNGSVGKIYTTFTCNNPGTLNSACSSQNETKTTLQCPSGCANGSCLQVKCNINSECNDNNNYTIDECVKPGTSESFCRNTEINCVSNLDCGVNGFIGNEFCSANNVEKNYQNSTCANAGTLNSYCQVSVEPRQIQQCQFACTQGGCIRCDADIDCSDGNSSTTDTCAMPGTINSHCSNTPIQNTTIACSSNLQCGTDHNVGSNFCVGNNVTANRINYMCNNPGQQNSFCNNSTTNILVQQCSFMCSNGTCVQQALKHDISLENLRFTLLGTPVQNNILVKNKSYGVLVDVLNKGNFTENVSFEGKIIQGNTVKKSFVHDAITSFLAGDNKKNKTKTVLFDLSPGMYNVSVKGNIVVDDNLNNNNVQRQVLVVECINSNDCSPTQNCVNPGTVQSYCMNNTNTITCNNNNDCGIDGFVGNNFCTLNNVTKNFVRYTCNNGGTTQSYCTNATSPSLVQNCGQNSASGNFCYQEDVYKNSTARGCSVNRCFANTALEKVQDCNFGCLNGVCKSPPTIVCSNNSQCNDNNPLTYDQCLNPGSAGSTCRNTEINCASNLDCGSNGFVGGEYCSVNNVLKNYQNATCNNPGTLNSYCTLQVSPVQTNTCQFACVDGGICARCNEDLDCNDGNSNTQDKCNNGGTTQSYCTNGGDLCINNGGTYQKVATTTIIPNSTQYTINAIPLNSSLWDFDNVNQVSQNDITNLTGLNVGSGIYKLVIVKGAWSRWMIDSFDTNPWGGNVRGGGPGITWESSAAVVYSQNNKTLMDRFGIRNLFAAKQQAENAAGSQIIINNTGSKLYVLLDDYPIYDNRGNVSVDIYKCQQPSVDLLCGANQHSVYKFSTTLIANKSNYVIPNQVAGFDMNTPKIIPPQNVNNLVNPFSLPAGSYVVQIRNGAISRWLNDSQDTTDFGGGPGLTWEATANTAYNDSGVMKNVRIGKSIFRTSGIADNAASGQKYMFSHSGGNIYIYIDDEPITDNRGSETLDVYQCVNN